MVDLVFIGMIYETIIIIIGAILVILVLNRYFKKRHVLTLYLLFIFFFMLVSIVFSWLSKIIVLTTELNYVYNEPIENVNPNVPFPWLLTRIVDFRITVFFVAIGTFISYILRVKVFEKGYNSLERAIIIIFGIYTSFFTLFIYVRGNTLLDAINFFNIMLYLLMVYLPFAINSLKAYKSVEERTFKNAFASLAIMSISFILVLVNILIDRITIIFGSSGFTAFYFAAWTLVIIGFTGAYFGYIRSSTAKES